MTLAKGAEETGEPVGLAVLPDQSVLHTARDGVDPPHRRERRDEGRGHDPRLQPRRGRPAGDHARPRVRDQPLGLRLLRPAARHAGRRRPVRRHARAVRRVQGRQPALALQVGSRDRAARPRQRAEAARGRPGPRHLLPQRRRLRVGLRRQPLPVHRRRHEPVRVAGLGADRRAGDAQPRARRPAQLGQHQRPARQDPAHQAAPGGGALRGAGGQPLQERRAPRDLRDGLPQPVPDRRRQGDRPRVRRRLRPRRRRRPGARARRPGRVQRRAPARQLRLALLHRGQRGLPRLRLRDRHVRRGVRLRGAGERLAAQHGRPAAPARHGAGHLVRHRRAVGGGDAARQLGVADGRPGLPLRRGQPVHDQVPRLLRRPLVPVRVGARLDQGDRARPHRRAARDQRVPRRRDAALAEPDGHGVRARGLALRARLRQQLVRRRPRLGALPRRLRQGRPAADRGGEREPDHDRRRHADDAVLQRGHGRSRRRPGDVLVGLRRRLAALDRARTRATRTPPSAPTARR